MLNSMTDTSTRSNNNNNNNQSHTVSPSSIQQSHQVIDSHNNSHSNIEKQGKAANATSSPSTDNSSTSVKPKGRRWQRGGGGEEDPIIAPGYGRQTDVERLTAALNRGSANNVQLPVSAVLALMRARGRGMTRSSKDEPQTPTGTSAAAVAATPISSAWADFMKEEGVNLNTTITTTAATTTTTTSSTAANTSRTKSTGDDTKPAATGLARNYLPLLWDTVKQAPQKKKARKHLQEGYLVQSGTLDFAIVGRGKLSADDFANHVYHLARPTRLQIPTLVTKVFSAGHAVHALCLDANGNVYGWGRNEAQQLGSDQPRNVYWPTVLSGAPSNVVQAATGKSHSLFLTADGQVYGLGSNKFGQCAVKPGPASETVGTPRVTAVPEGVAMAEVRFIIKSRYSWTRPMCLTLVRVLTFYKFYRLPVEKTFPLPFRPKDVSTRPVVRSTDNWAMEKRASTLSRPISWPLVIVLFGRAAAPFVTEQMTR